MKLINQHIVSNFDEFLSIESEDFEIIFDNIRNDAKADFKMLLKYLYQLMKFRENSINSTVSPLHIHLSNNSFDYIRDLIAEFILLNNHFSTLKDQSINFESLDNEIQVLINRVEKFCYPARKSKENRFGITTVEYNKIITQQKKYKKLIRFYKSFNKKIKLNLLFNSTVNQIARLKEVFEEIPFAIEIQDKTYCSNLLNLDKSLNEIDDFNDEILNDLKSIILFDCERKSIMLNFSFDEIIKWNSEYDTNFKKYLIVTFGNLNPTINSIRNKIETITEKYKIPENTTYTILSSEIDFLQYKKEKSTIPVEFLGFETSSFWDTFLLEVNIRDFYELRSIKMMNIYSICLNDDIKSYILDDLFSKSESSELISISTKIAILELRDEIIALLKESLSNTLDSIIHSKIKSKIIEKISYSSTVILDDSIIRNSKLSLKFLHALDITKNLKLKNWSELTNGGSTSFLILSYRDQGKYPNYYYPNLLEFQYEEGNRVVAILHNFFFGNHFRWSKYTILKDYQKYLSHPIRDAHFDWDKLKKLIQNERPLAKIDIDWNLENEFSTSENRDAYKIKTVNQRAKTYHSSDLLIFSEIKTASPKIERVKWFFENEDIYGTKYKIQKLDELLDEFNPAERLIDTTQQELELEIIRKQLGLGNETAGRIWKTLLRNKSELLGVETLYEELKLIFDKNNIPLVSINHFRNSWINIESDSLMPRGNKVFKFLCNYLELNNNYRLILYRLKNASISGKIEATKKYSNLLKDLFADGCFDSNPSIETILKSRITFYRNNHSLEELGIDNVNPLSGLTTLIELIQPELKLIELETIEKLSNE